MDEVDGKKTERQLALPTAIAPSLQSRSLPRGCHRYRRRKLAYVGTAVLRKEFHNYLIFNE